MALIAAIYGHDVEDRDVQYDVVLCLCHSVFTSQRRASLPLPPTPPHPDGGQGGGVRWSGSSLDKGVGGALDCRGS